MIAVTTNDVIKSVTHEPKQYPGLITCSDSCCCELHGFEVDMDGKIIMPLLSPGNAQDCKNLMNCATKS
jgi:hypothetical protein